MQEFSASMETDPENPNRPHCSFVYQMTHPEDWPLNPPRRHQASACSLQASIREISDALSPHAVSAIARIAYLI